MANIARRDLIVGETYFHITWQFHNNEWFLNTDVLKKLYYNLLVKYKDKYNIQIFGYSLMDSHPHLIGFTKCVEDISDFMRVVNTCLAKQINKLHNRKGQVIMDRFKSPVIETGNNLLKVLHYADLNAVRAGKVDDPANYQWSSYRYYAFGEPDPLVTPAPVYIALANTPSERQTIYQNMVKAIIEFESQVKNEYSKVLYIGDPDWVLARYKYIRQVQKEKRMNYLERRKKRFNKT